MMIQWILEYQKHNKMLRYLVDMKLYRKFNKTIRCVSPAVFVLGVQLTI